MKLIVNIDNYTPFEYLPFSKDGVATKRPKNTKYEVGQVVYIKHTNTLGVVLGCIDNFREELRTDADGMQCFSDIRPATMEDFNIKGVNSLKRLKAECEGKIVHYNWDTYKEEITEKNDF